MKLNRFAFRSPRALLASLLVSGMLRAGAQTPTPPQTLVLTETNNGTTVEAVLQQSISVNLPENPSTPAGWLCLGGVGTSVVSNGPSVYLPDLPVLPGSPGTLVWPYLAVSPGLTTLNFACCQRYAPTNVLFTYAVTIDVLPPPPTLSLALAGDYVVITWPITNSDGFFLEGTASLQPALWAGVNVIMVRDGQNYRVALPRGGAPFYLRLHKD